MSGWRSGDGFVCHRRWEGGVSVDVDDGCVRCEEGDIGRCSRRRSRRRLWQWQRQEGRHGEVEESEESRGKRKEAGRGDITEGGAERSSGG